MPKTPKEKRLNAIAGYEKSIELWKRNLAAGTADPDMAKRKIAAHEQLILGSLVSPGPLCLHYPAGAPPLLPPLQLQALLSPTQQTIQALQPSSSFAAPACSMSGGRDYGSEGGSGGTVLPALGFLGGQESLLQVSSVQLCRRLRGLPWPPLLGGILLPSELAHACNAEMLTRNSRTESASEVAASRLTDALLPLSFPRPPCF